MNFLSIFSSNIVCVIVFLLDFKLLSANNGIRDHDDANAFVTFHVRNERILTNIHKIQQEFLQLDPDFQHTFQPIQSLHVTIMIIHLNVQNAKNASEALTAIAENWHQKLAVRLKGIGHNGNASMYAAVEKRSMAMLIKLQELTIAEFGARGIRPLNPFNETHYSPHMTILYLTRPSDQRLIRWWPKEEHRWAGKWLGKEHVEVLQLCNITLDDRSQDYNVLFEAKLAH